MDTDELMRIVRDERLDAPVLFGAGRLHDDAVVLEQTGGAWQVYLVDERHSAIASTVRVFESESEALEHVLRKLRQVAQARRAIAAARSGSAHG